MRSQPKNLGAWSGPSADDQTDRSPAKEGCVDQQGKPEQEQQHGEGQQQRAFGRRSGSGSDRFKRAVVGLVSGVGRFGGRDRLPVALARLFSAAHLG